MKLMTTSERQDTTNHDHRIPRQEAKNIKQFYILTNLFCVFSLRLAHSGKHSLQHARCNNRKWFEMSGFQKYIILQRDFKKINKSHIHKLQKYISRKKMYQILRV